MKNLKKFGEIFENDNTEANDQLLESIDWTGMEKEVSERLGTPVKLKTKMEKGRNGGYVDVESEELIKKAGIFQSVFNSVTINATNYGLSDDKDFYSVILSLRWSHKEGGTNGTTLVHGNYVFKDKAWKFRK
jgi:hypothetical protein